MKKIASYSFRRNPDVAWRILDGCLVVVTPKDTTLHRMNPTGTFIWTFLAESPKTGSAILAALVRSFDVPEKKAEGDLSRFIGTALKKNILLQDR